MNFATMKASGRRVIVDTAREQVRMVNGKEHFTAPTYVNVFLDGNWQTVRQDSIKNEDFGHPFRNMEDIRRKAG